MCGQTRKVLKTFRVYPAHMRNPAAIFSTSGDYQLGSTVGQPDAGVLSGGGYTLVGGFWGGAAIQYRIYLPLVLRLP